MDDSDRRGVILISEKEFQEQERIRREHYEYQRKSKKNDRIFLIVLGVVFIFAFSSLFFK